MVGVVEFIVCFCGWLFGVVIAHATTPYNQEVSWKHIIEFGIVGTIVFYCLFSI